MEHRAPIIEETEKEVCFQVLALPINNIDVLIYQWTISDRHLLHSCTTIVTLFSFTLSFHGLQSSPPSFDTKVAFFKSHKSPGSSDILDAKKQQGQLLCDYCTSAKHPHCSHLQSGTKMSYLPSTGFDQILTLFLEAVFTKSTNYQSLKMTAPAPCKPLLVCGTGIYFGSFAHPLYREFKHLFN